MLSLIKMKLANVKKSEFFSVWWPSAEYAKVMRNVMDFRVSQLENSLKRVMLCHSKRYALLLVVAFAVQLELKYMNYFSFRFKMACVMFDFWTHRHREHRNMHFAHIFLCLRDYSVPCSSSCVCSMFDKYLFNRKLIGMAMHKQYFVSINNVWWKNCYLEKSLFCWNKKRTNETISIITLINDFLFIKLTFHFKSQFLMQEKRKIENSIKI